MPSDSSDTLASLDSYNEDESDQNDYSIVHTAPNLVQP